MIQNRCVRNNFISFQMKNISTGLDWTIGDCQLSPIREEIDQFQTLYGNAKLKEEVYVTNFVLRNPGQFSRIGNVDVCFALFVGYI